MKTKTIFFIVVAVFMLVGTACGGDNDSGGDNDGGGDDDSGGNNGSGNCPDFAEEVVGEDGVCKVYGPNPITKDITFTSNIFWILDGAVTIGENNKDMTADIKTATLTIEPGTKIAALEGRHFLVINRGSKIIASGTKEKPIVFTSAKEEGKRRRGDWGGLIINGWAPVNCAKDKDTLCQRQAETGSEWYGGDKPEDNSGVIKYVRIEFTGHKINQDKEFNGLTLGGVGNQTTIENIHVHMGNDDAVEFFGGTVNAKYILCTGAADDSLDWTYGYSGKIQHLMIEQYEDAGDRGIEADTNSKKLDDEPVSLPTVANVTILGHDNAKEGVLFRAGTGGHIYNLMVGGSKFCLDIDNGQTFIHAENRKLALQNTIFSCTQGGFKENDEKGSDGQTIDDPWPSNSSTKSIESWFNGQSNNKVVDNLHLEGWLPKSDSPALEKSPVPSDDPFFDKVDYIGAFGKTDWTKGWTKFPKN